MELLVTQRIGKMYKTQTEPNLGTYNEKIHLGQKITVVIVNKKMKKENVKHQCNNSLSHKETISSFIMEVSRCRLTRMHQRANKKG